MMRRLRAWFEAQDVLEVDTPALSPYAVSDTQIESLEVRSSAVSRRPLYLHTSPEYCMKRLLAAGYPDIYSICRVFRDGESGRQHQPEFTMVEWYRRGFSLDDIVNDTVGVIGAALDLAAPQETVRHDYCDLFVDAVGIDPRSASSDALADAARADDSLREAIGQARDDWLDLVLSTRIVTAFPTDRFTAIAHYPASQAALARLYPRDPRLADRFEVFMGPTELANGYVELTDADEQARRFRHDNEERERRGRSIRPTDSTLLRALEHGLPPCAGVAMGFERLQMIHDQADDIRDVVTFAYGAER